MKNIRGIRRMRAPGLVAVAVVTIGALAGCGGSSSSSAGGSASELISQTFSTGHRVDSGNLHFSLTVTPSGSSTLKGPLSLSFGGPFQSRGQGKVPASDFTIAVSGFGKSGSLGLLSTGTAGYVKLSGSSYQLPAATFQKLESSFSSVAGSGGSGGPLGKLGIDPRQWLTNPTVVGHESLDGTDTAHITAGVDVNRLLDGLSTVLQHANQLGVQGAGTSVPSLSPSERSKIAAAIQHPKVDMWTGSADKTLRKMTVSLSVPITGQASALLGGLSSAGIQLTVGYSAVNQPQTISAPANVRSYAEFQQRMNALVGALRGSVTGSLGGLGGLGGASSSGGSGAATSPSAGGAASASSAGITAYAQCIQSAGSDVTKMQSCAGLLGKK